MIVAKYEVWSSCRSCISTRSVSHDLLHCKCFPDAYALIFPRACVAEARPKRQALACLEARHPPPTANVDCPAGEHGLGDKITGLRVDETQSVPRNPFHFQVMPHALAAFEMALHPRKALLAGVSWVRTYIGPAGCSCDSSVAVLPWLLCLS